MYDLKDGTQSLDSLHGEEYRLKMDDVYQKTGKGPYGSPGMLMGFVSYASLVSKEVLDQTIAEVRANSLAETDFEKRQEDVIVKQLSGEQKTADDRPRTTLTVIRSQFRQHPDFL